MRMTATALPPAALSPTDQAKFIAWAEASRPVTRMDPEVVSYPRAAIMVASDNEIRAFATMQSLLFVDNYIPQPGLEDRKRALALAKFERLVAEIARDSEHREVMFTTKDLDYAAVAEGRGWQVQKDMIVLRKKVGA